MSQIYLSRISIDNFRVYGPDFSLALPPGPGLTLISGCNGLGKTTFFDAAEWALTGRVARIQSELKSQDLLPQLLRADSFVQASECQVSLDFGADGGLVRAASEGANAEGRVVVTGTDGVELNDEIALLRAANWRPTIQELRVYLGLTHFLPQSERPRFFRLETPRMWDALKGPTGAAHLDSLRGQLGRETMYAFNRAKENAERGITEAKATLDKWQQQSRQLEELRRVASAGTGLPPNALALELAEIRRELGEAGRGIDAALESDQALAAVAAALSAFERGAAINVEYAANGADIAKSWQQTTDQLTSARAGLTLAERQDSADRQTLLDAGDIVRETVQRQENLRLERRQSTARLDALATLAGAFEGEFLETRSIARLDVELAAAQADLDTWGRAQESAIATISAHEQLRAQREFTGSEEESLKAILDLLERCLAAEELVRERGPEYRLIEQRVAQARADLAVAVSTERRSEEVLSAAETRLQIAQTALDEIGRAVAQLASLLPEQERTCPFCATDFPSSDLLRNRAAACASRGHGNLRSLFEDVASARLAVTQARNATANILREGSAAAEAETAMAAVKAEASLLRARLDGEPRLAGQPVAAQVGLVTRLFSQSHALNEQLEARQAGLPNYANALRYLADANEGRLAAASRVARLQADLSAAHSRREICRLQLAEGDALLDTSSRTLAGVQEEQLQARNTIVLLELQLAAADREVAEARDRFAAAESATMASRSRLAVAADAVARLEQACEGLETRWIGLSFPGTPDLSFTEGLRLEAVARLESYHRLDGRRETALRGWTLWLSHEALHQAEAARNAQLAQGERSEHRASALEQAVQNAMAHQARVLAADKLRRNLAEKLRDQQQEFTDSVLNPLGKRVTAFERLISPFQHRVVFDGRHRSDSTTRFNVSVELPRLPGSDAGTYEMHTRLSEGQVSALGVSMIFGTSTAYNWSRWPALMLDDPLQHTDLIHASAFIDVLRALIIECGYQIILSSHDQDESDFIERKCRRFRIPVQRCTLVGAGEQGVRWHATDNF